MAETTGRVTSIAINGHKVSFALDRKAERFVIYDEAPNTQTVPQFELATKSWMLSILQTAFTSTKDLKVKHDDKRLVSQIELHDPLKINIDVDGMSSPTTGAIKGPGVKPLVKKKR